jgi:hypothetical protein
MLAHWKIRTMRFLPAEEQAMVIEAQARGIPESFPTPAYLSPNLCTVLSLVLALPTLGYSLLMVPILWVAQHDHTDRRLRRLRLQLERQSHVNAEASTPQSAPHPAIPIPESASTRWWSFRKGTERSTVTST